jgi:hypothetical protein
MRRHNGSAVTKAENGYDYAGQDPINGYDLDGTFLQDPEQNEAVHGPTCCQINTDSDPNWRAPSPGAVAHKIGHALAPVKQFVREEWGSCVASGAVGAAANAGDPAGSVASGFALGCAGSVAIDVVVRFNQPAGNILIVLATGGASYQFATGRFGRAYLRVLLKALEAGFKP